MKNLCVIIFLLVITLTNLQAQTTNIQEKLTELSRLGVHYKYLDETTIELRDTLTDYYRIKTIKETNTEEIYNWANAKGIPVIEFNPALIDTTKWTGWYDYWTYVIVSNAEHRIPTKTNDLDGNGFSELYGLFGGVGFDPEFRIWEVYPDGTSAQRYSNQFYQVGLSTFIVDIDNNGLQEVVYHHGQNSYVYEQSATSSLPTNLKFVFNKYDGLGGYLSVEKMANMDGDSLIDFVHRGADTSLSPYYLTYISEYNPSVQNFEKKWCLEPVIGPNIGFIDGYDVGDYDGDGKMEAIASTLWGKIRIVENTGDDTYAINFLDSLPLVNMFFQASGDLDKDGKREFFIGATMGNGNWTTMFESDGDNTYSPKIILHLISGGSLDDPTYITDDIDDDGNIELAILSGGYLYIFKSDADNSYYLWYLKRGPASFSFNFADMNGDGIKDILWSSIRTERWATDIYKGTDLVNVKDDIYFLPERLELFQNYPNPFNPSTVISYQLPVRTQVSIIVYDLLGREVATLVNEYKSAGSFSIVFNTNNLSSGLYVYQLRTEFRSISKKMLLIK